MNRPAHSSLTLIDGPDYCLQRVPPGRLGSELQLLLSSGGSQSFALTVPVCASQRTFLRLCLSD
ncbi:MAG: hypothetical protein IJI41_11060 [Anaerolineaceae bacterium]|nr:hypothetical protein [Anaerolineaceae bacterium]